MEKLLAEYFLNSIWQIPLLTLGVWILVRVLRPTPKVQYRIWIAALWMLVAMPLASRHSTSVAAIQTPARTFEQNLSPAHPETFVPTELLEHASSENIPISSPPETTTVFRSEGSTIGWSRPVHWPVREIQLDYTATLWVISLYLLTIGFAFIRLVFGARSARRVLVESNPVQLGRAESLLLDQCCQRLDVMRPPVLETADIRSPMVVGILHPALLLPSGFANSADGSAAHSKRALEAVWLHELAHIQRRDCFTNLACRIISMPIGYHPVVWAVRRRIRQTQEMLCDAVAAREMKSVVGYARALVGLAQKIQRNDWQVAPVFGTTMFDGNILEERVMQLIETRKAVPVRTRLMRFTCGAAVALAVIASAATFHVLPTMAQTPDPVTQSAATTESAPAARSGQANPSNATIEADDPGSAHQIENATRQFDAALEIINSHLNRSASGNVDASYQHAEIEMQVSQARIEAQSAALAATGEAEMRARIATEQAMVHDPQLQLQMGQTQTEFNSPEFKKRMEDMQEKFNSPEFKKKMAEMQAHFNSPEFKEKMKELNSAEMQKRMADAQARFNSPEFKKLMADVQAKFNSPEFKKQMADMHARFNSPEFKEKMKRFNSPEFQKQIAEATARVNNPEFKRKLDDLNQKYKEQVQELMRQFNVPPTTPPAPNTP